MIRWAAYNKRFYESGGVCPQTVLWKIARLSPAASVVEAATSPSRWGVRRHSRTATVRTKVT